MQVPSISDSLNISEILKRLQAVRNQSIKICEPLKVEDYVVQPVTDVSPPKWHLAHTTWFFEAFILSKYFVGYQVFRKDFHYLFNSYYVSAGERWARADRGNLTRPTVDEIFEYRKHVDFYMKEFLEKTELNAEVLHVLEVGIQHEQQHQELLIYDIKYILGHNPVFPEYKEKKEVDSVSKQESDWLKIEAGIYEIGHSGSGYCFDNELGQHKYFLYEFEISDSLVTNKEYLQFVKAGGYQDHFLWLSEGWDWVNNENITSPMYWVLENNEWLYYTLAGLRNIDWDAPVSHISFYEADAFAKWKKCRLPTEQEWEVAARKYEPSQTSTSNFVEDGVFEAIATNGFNFLGNLWEWTASAYRPYPFYQVPEGALGEYNGKFMINQMVLKGGSYATPKDHIRHSYRNFFHPHLCWMTSGFRLARH